MHHRLGVVAVEGRRLGVEHALAAHPAVGRPLRHQKVVFRLGADAMVGLEGKRCRGVDMAWVEAFHIGSLLVEPLEVVANLVAHGEQAERGVVAIFAEDAL